MRKKQETIISMIFFSFFKMKYQERIPQMMNSIKRELYSQTQQNKQDLSSMNCQFDPQAFQSIIDDPR